MGSLIATNLMLVMFIFLCANSNASEESERKICEFCTHTPGFPSKREGAQRGITIGICKDDEAPQNQKCSKKSDQCVIMKLKRACSTSTQATLEKYFPKDAEGAELKGCWKSDQTDEVKSMMESCGGELEFIQICNENVCNKEIPKVRRTKDVPIIKNSLYMI